MFTQSWILFSLFSFSLSKKFHLPQPICEEYRGFPDTHTHASEKLTGVVCVSACIFCRKKFPFSFTTLRICWHMLTHGDLCICNMHNNSPCLPATDMTPSIPPSQCIYIWRGAFSDKALQYECRILVAKSLFLYWALFQAPISILGLAELLVPKCAFSRAVFVVGSLADCRDHDLCWRMLTCADVCLCMHTYAYVCWRMLAYAGVCWRMPTQKIWVIWGKIMAEQEFQWWIALGYNSNCFAVLVFTRPTKMELSLPAVLPGLLSSQY